MPCSNAAKTQNPLKFVGVPQTRQQISAVTRPKFTILSEHVEEVLLLNKFFPIVDTCLRCEDIARQSCGMVPRWRLFDDFWVPYLQRAARSTFQTCSLNRHLGHTRCRTAGWRCQVRLYAIPDRCLSCLSVLCVTLVYCGQTVGWIKTKLSTEVGRGHDHNV